MGLQQRLHKENNAELALSERALKVIEYSKQCERERPDKNAEYWFYTALRRIEKEFGGSGVKDLTAHELSIFMIFGNK